MASLVLGVAGAAALGPAGLAWGGALGMSGAQIGFMAGSMLGNMLTKLPDVQGPRMGDLKVQASTYGTPIPIYYGTSRGAGQIMWSSDLIETEHEQDAGGKGGPSQSVTSYTYSVNCAVAICEGEISGIRKIWANGDLIFDQSTTNSGPTGQSDNIRVYTGSESQVADSLLESYLGAGNVPAHRGLAYVVFENLQLEKFGNRIPNFSFEVITSGAVTQPTYTHISDQFVYSMMPHPFVDGLVLSLSHDNGDSQPVTLHVIDLISKTERIIPLGDIPSSYCTHSMTHVLIRDPVTLLATIDEIWVSFDTIYLGYSDVVAIALDTNTLAFKRTINAGTPNFSFIGNMHFDSTINKVLFATANTSVAEGYNYLDPLSETWESVTRFESGNDAWTGHGAKGESAIALSNLSNNVGIFIGCQFVARIATTEDFPWIAYDSLRERFAWYNGDVSSKMTFQTVNESGFDVNYFYPTTIGLPAGGFFSLDYFPIADKYILCDQYTVYTLNADTFEVESSKTIVIHPWTIRTAIEIAAMPEYIGLNVNSTQDGVALVPMTDRLSSNTVTLSSIVTDICDRVGLATGDIDVSGLTDEVEGYTIGQQITARAAIDGLQAAFYFDAVESD